MARRMLRASSPLFYTPSLRLRERACPVECGKGCARVLVELPTELRGRRAFAPPQEERQAQLFFERTERFRDGLDRHALRPRSTGKGADAHDGAEVTKLLYIHTNDHHKHG